MNNNTADFLMVVDIQPGYYQNFNFILPDLIEKINNINKPIIYFYNGKSTGLDDKYDVISFLLENGGDEDKINQIKFIEKDYGFFRNWMDRGVNEQEIIKAIQLMEEKNYSTTEDFTQEDWSNIAPNNPNLQFEEPIYFPDFNKYLLKMEEVDNIEMIGGGRYECLDEIQIYLKSLNKTTFVNEKLCYGADVFKPKHKMK